MCAANRELRLEIAHVLFIDIVGYSKCATDHQTEMLEQLNAAVRGSKQVRTAEKNGELTQLPTGDGVALVFRHDPEAPARAAMEISRALEASVVPVRMGINSGPVNLIVDVNGQQNFTGAGINLAQRVMDCGDAGHILLSKRTAEDLAQSRQWQRFLHELGECSVKHGATIYIVNFYDQEFGNAQSPEKLKLTKSALRGRARLARLLLSVAVLLLVVLAVVFYIRRGRMPQSPEPKSLAVLPFENLSDNQANAFFADGIQDDLLTNLAKIQDLRVISRTSTMSYRNTARNLREIAAALGVTNVIEGSVRRVNDRVVVNVQLIDALHDRHLWANRYDRTVADSLGLEGELADQIASALKATLTAEEKDRVTRKPTENASAWVLYLEALQLILGPDNLLQDFRKAEGLLSQAIELDPNFALAHARLAALCADIYHFYEPTAERKEQAKKEGETALRLQPNLSEGHFALGQYIYWVEADYDRALTEFARAQELSPSDTNIGVRVASIRRRQGRWDEALREFERIEKLDPRNAVIVRNVMFTNGAMRRWPQASAAGARLLAVMPRDSVVSRIQTGYIAFQWKGETDTLKASLAQLPVDNDPDGAIVAARWETAMIDRDFTRAAEVLESSPLTEIGYFGAGLSPKDYLLGLTALARRDAGEAKKRLEGVVSVFERDLKSAPEIAERHATLGALYAFLERHDDAIREGERAVELKPVSKDAFDGAIMQCFLALICARVGEKDRAIALIERLLQTPGAVDTADYSITQNDLRYRWEWDPLRNEPRFRNLLAEPATK